jgi:hypothetical protein
MDARGDMEAMIFCTATSDKIRTLDSSSSCVNFRSEQNSTDRDQADDDHLQHSWVHGPGGGGGGRGGRGSSGLGSGFRGWALFLAFCIEIFRLRLGDKVIDGAAAVDGAKSTLIIKG